MDELNDLLKGIEFKHIFSEKVVENLVNGSIQKIKDTFNRESDKIEKKAKKDLESEQYEYFKENWDLEISEKVVLNHIDLNLTKTRIWCAEIDFSTALKAKKLKKAFVELDLYVSPLKNRFDHDEKVKRVKSLSLLNSFKRNKLIYGGAGAGKTTLIKKLCSNLLESNQSRFTLPLVIRFREIDYDSYEHASRLGLYKILLDSLGIRIIFPETNIDTFHNEYYGLLKQTVSSFLDDNNILLIVDGFDEIPDHKVKVKVQKEFQELALSLKNARFILTSRSNDFKIDLENTREYEICPLNDKQICSVINGWLKSKKQAQDLYDKIKVSPYYDATMRPLTLAHLCAIYERRKTIPPKPRDIYDFILNLLLENWDQQRNVVRPSKYANFYIEQKKKFLGHLAFWLTYHLQKTVFTTEEIRKCYNQIRDIYELPPSQAKKVVTELENHTGLFIQTGSSSYQFSHRSLQEFLTARYIDSLPNIPSHELLSALPEETAIAMCLSSSPNMYFDSFIRDFDKYTDHFWTVCVNRLIDERPGFDKSPGVLVFFLSIITSFLADAKSNSYSVQSMETEKLLEKQLVALLESTNLKISFKEFLKIYLPNGVMDDYHSYLHKNMGRISLRERNYYPSKIWIPKHIVEVLLR
jgi:hypothetical protein